MYKLYILSCVISEIGYISYKLQLSRLIAGLPWLSIICIPTSDLPCDGNATGMFAFFGTVGYFFLKWHSYFTEPVRLPFCTSVCNTWTKDNGRKFFMKEHYSLSSHLEQGGVCREILWSTLLHRGVFCQFPFPWIYWYGSNKVHFETVQLKETDFENESAFWIFPN